VRYLVCLVVVALGACSAADPPPTAPERPRAHRAAPVLVFFQRNGGLAATLDALTIRTDGRARLDKRNGGGGRRFEDFRLTPALLARLKREVAKLPARLPESARAGRRQGATYLVRVGRRSGGFREGAVPAPMRSFVATLNGVVDGDGRAGPGTGVRQGLPQ
jgi:hypothetical protein